MTEREKHILAVRSVIQEHLEQVRSEIKYLQRIASDPDGDESSVQQSFKDGIKARIEQKKNALAT